MNRELLQQALDALRQCEFTSPPAQRPIVKGTITALRSALAAPMPEPVALMELDDINELMHCNGMSVFVENPRIYPPYCEGEPLVGFVPLYAAPPAAPAPVVREPLTDEQLETVARDSGIAWSGNMFRDVMFAACRAVERAHGIGGGGK